MSRASEGQQKQIVARLGAPGRVALRRLLVGGCGALLLATQVGAACFPATSSCEASCGGCCSCDSNGNDCVCLTGDTDQACGSGGSLCADCATTAEKCLANVCIVPSCTNQGDECGAASECCSDCCSGGLCAAASVCTSSCVHDQGGCAYTVDCCSGLGCSSSGLCTSACAAAGDPCGAVDFCCSGLACADGLCTNQCGDLAGTSSCDATTPCCEGLTCDSTGSCQRGVAPACIAQGETCGSGAVCCTGLTCSWTTNSCETCGGANTACSTSGSPCCAGLICDSSATCQQLASCQGVPCAMMGTPCCIGASCAIADTSTTDGDCQLNQALNNGTCGSQTVAGGDQGITQSFDMGQVPATFVFSWDTYSIPDRIVVYHDGTLIYDTTCTGDDLGTAGSGQATLTLGSGSQTITVSVTPDCNGETNTAWDFVVNCPQ